MIPLNSGTELNEVQDAFQMLVNVSDPTNHCISVPRNLNRGRNMFFLVQLVQNTVKVFSQSKYHSKSQKNHYQVNFQEC